MEVSEISKKYSGKVAKISFGTGFVYCGTIDDDLDETIRRASKFYLERDKVYRLKEMNKVAALKRKIPDEVIRREIKKREQRIQKLEDNIESFKPFSERKVLSISKCTDKTDVMPIDMIIVCEGTEEGRYWTVKEYLSDKRRSY